MRMVLCVPCFMVTTRACILEILLQKCLKDVEELLKVQIKSNTW